MGYQSTIPPSKTKPVTQGSRAPPLQTLQEVLSINFSLWTWLLIGASSQAALMSFAGLQPICLLLPVSLLAIRATNACLQHWKITPNPYMKDVFLNRRTALVPNEEGVVEGASREKVVICLLGAKTNHPFGFFNPEFIKTFQWLQKMNASFDSADAPKGFLGQTNWSRKDERGAIEFVFISYWRSVEDLHEFAFSPLHREAWSWWEKTLKEHDCIGICHEIYEAQPGHYENMYTNFQPTGLGATSYLKINDKFQSGVVDDEWISPLMDARRGPLAKSSGRLGRAPIKFDSDRPNGAAYL